MRLYYKMIKALSIIYISCLSFSTAAEQPYVVSNSGFSQGQFESCASSGQYACFRVFAGRRGDNYIGGTCHTASASSTYNLGDVQVSHAIVREMAADDRADFWFNGRHFQVEGGTGGRPCELGRTSYNRPNANIGSLPQQFTVNANILVSGMGEAWGTMDVYYIPYFQDYGDAPDASNGTGPGNYRTRQADNGPSHRALRSTYEVYLGATLPDDDGTGLQNVDATADDLNAGSSYYGIAADDENGVTFPNLKYTDANYSITANVTNSSGADAYLYAWIDFDNSGTFDVDELFSSGTGSGNEFIVADGSIDTPQTLTWNSLAELTANGYYYSRVRISETQLTTTAIGSAEDTRSFGASSAAGEVEDYKFCVGCVDITGYIYDDVNGDSDLADKVGVSGVSVYLYTDDGDMTPNAADGGPTLTTTTDADGYYAFVEIPGLTYFVSPNPPTSSSALAEQTYTTSQTDNTNGTFVTGYCDANADGVADTTPIAVTGACYGGWDGDRANTSSSADLSAREHISRVIFSANSNSVNQLDFGFSYNAVTNTEITGQGSLEQFIINANAIAGANNMRFVPVVAANDADASADWWVISPTSSLTTITGTNGANTTLDGQAYSHTDGVTLLDTNSGDYAASQTVGSSHLCSVENIAALAKPELQIDLPTNASAYSAEIIIINADNTTVRNLSLTGGSQGINVYSGGITDTVIEYNLIGIDPAGNDAVIGQETCGTSSGCAGIAIANSGNSALHGNSGIIRNNAIKTAHHNISLNSLNSQTAVINWQLQHNLLLGTTSTTSTPYHVINIRYGAPAYLTISGNQIENATGDGIFQANTSNVDLLQNFSSNTIINNAEDGIDIHSGKLSIIECNILNNNGDSGIAIDGNTNVEGFLITKNSFNNNVDNSIDLHNSTTGSGVSLNNDNCINDTGTGANNNLARPVIYYAFIDNNDLRLIGDVCATGDYTLEVYKANAGSGDAGSDGLSAGEGAVYLGSLTAMSGAGFDNTLTVNGVSVGDQITVIAQRTTLTSGTYLQDTSEFSANMVVDIDNKDWGDAPDTTSMTAKEDYTTRRTVGGASHIVTTSGNGTDADFFLGAFVDTDIDGQPNVAGDGDNLVDVADEDGVTASGFYVLNRDRDIVVTVGKHSSYSGSTFHVYGWIDWNQDGDWLDSNEQIISDTSATVGSQTYTVTTPATAILGKTYARFRICSTGDCNVPTGPSIDGEVEDYGEIIISADFGDAPDTGVGIGAGNYRTTLADDGPRHSIDSDLFLGTTASDTEIDGLQNVTASGDNIDVSDDEDSLLLLPLTSGATAYNAQAVVTNNTGSTGYLYAWLDTNRDGEFDRDEFISNGSGPGGALIIADGSTAVATALVWATISSPTNNSTVYLRTRLTSAPLTDSVSGAVEDPRSYGYANGGEVEDYALQVADQDFGDLDDTFATLGLSGGPYHGLSNKTNIYIGSATIDTEGDGQPSVDADADDLTGSADENAFSSPTPILPLTASTYSAYVAVRNNTSTDAYLYGWLDWNQNNQFEPEEYAVVTVAHGTTTSSPITLTFSNITGQTEGRAALRLRYTTAGLSNLGWGGGVPDGEVEDHYIMVGSYDFGDAPDTVNGVGANNQRTLLRDDGPRHGIDNQLFFGAGVDAEQDANNPTNSADGDDIDANGDDEDGALLIPLHSSASSYTLPITVTNTTSSDAYIYAWIDFDRTTGFDRDEFAGGATGVPITVAAGTVNGAVSINWNSLPGIAINTDVYIRLRLTTDNLPDTTTGTLEDPRSYGSVTDGEVEDYYLRVDTYDGGDAPDIYHTLYTSNGPSHYHTNTNLYIRNATHDDVHDLDGQPNNAADGDDIDGSDDENSDDLTRIPLLGLSDTTYTLGVPLYNGTGVNANLYGWIDFNKNGRFDDDGEFAALESIANSTNTSNQATPTTTLTWNNISGQAQGSTYVRLRITNDILTKDDWGGMALNGEVEDHQVFIGDFDFGDAPDTANGVSANNYRTNFNDNGAYHGLDANVYLGAAAPDTENNANTPAIYALGDDQDVNGDDEDGVFILPLHNTVTTYALPVTATNNSGANAYLYAWIDFDRNGRFDRDEFVGGAAGSPITIATGTTSATLDAIWDSFPGIAVNTDVYARFRITTDLLSDSVTGTTEDPRSYGGVTDGEVEDYYIRVDTYDGGDAPDSYDTLYLSDGPAHYHVNANLYIRSATHDDAHDTDGLPTVGADGDDNDGVDDEDVDSLTKIPLLGISDTTYTLGVPLYNGTGVNANLYAWIDFNQDGDFADAGEFTSLENIINGTNTLNQTAPTTELVWNGIGGLTQGSTYVRIRLTNDTLTASDWGGFALNGEVEDHQIFIGNYDFGDAPDTANGVAANNYRTTLNDGGPYHGLNNNLYLGAAAPDTENDANAPAILALGDDDDVNGDDEDGVFIMPLHNSVTNYGVRSVVTNNTGRDAYIYAWIDFDRNGRFDRDEFAGGAAGAPIVVNSGVSNFVANINWNSFPGIANNTDVYVRVRLTSELLSDAVTGTTEDPRSFGGAVDGEVEDYYLRVDTYDGGDLPESYQTSYSNGGPAHYHTNANLYIRDATHDNNHDEDGQPTAAANGDDNDGTDDENADSLVPLPILTLTDTSYTVGVPLYNATGADANLYAWLDLNQDGDFDDAGEFASLEGLVNGTNTSAQTAPTTQLTWTGISGQTTGDMALRLRLTSDILTATDWGGIAKNGEVEDHYVYVGDPDFGDAPDTSSATAANNYQTLYNYFGPYHLFVDGLYIGNTAPDIDDGTLQDITATADDLDATDDEGPITLPPLFNGMDSYKITVPVTNTTGNIATLAVWIDFNRNGQFDDSEGQIAVVPTGSSNTPVELEWAMIPAVTNNTTSFVRLRLTNRLVGQISDISSLGGEAGGEVEDHSIFFGLQDLGDAPASYLVDPLLGGPHHIITNNTNLYLGTSTIDGDEIVLASVDALGDDNNGSDDENGTSQPLTSIPINGSSHSLDLTVRNTTGNDAYLAGWIDSNRNGIFDEIEGRVDVIPTTQNGVYTYSFDSNQMQNLSVGNTFIRFRLTTDPLTTTDVGGRASDGEVEDFMIQIGGQDLGDLPDTSSATAANNYQTNLTFGGPYHNVAAEPNLYLGTVAPDVDDATPQSTDATGDNVTGIDDENALADIALPDLDAGDNYDTNITVTNSSTSTAYLYAWIDWDRDGNFESDEIAQASINSLGSTQAINNGVITIPASTGTETYTVTFTTDTALVDARTYGVRLRLTTELLTDGDATATVDERSLGAAQDGEVEDFFVTAENTDLGDLPDSYLTLPVSGGPAHYYVSNLYLGANNIDDDDQAYPDAAALGDDNTGVDDETGLVEPLTTVATSITSYSVDLAVYNYSGSNATLVAWLDTNQDGSFSADEVVDDLNVVATSTPFSNAIFASDNLPTSSNNLTNKVTLTWNGISGLTQGSMGLRIRVANTSLTANDWGGIAQGGEVEDYVVYVGQFDFGDAIDSAANIGVNNYRTTLSDNGAYHGIDNTILMGALLDSESDANDPTTAFAQGDNITGSNDEDGAFIPPLNNTNTTYNIPVTVTNNSGSKGYLYAWIDFDRNGRFDRDEFFGGNTAEPREINTGNTNTTTNLGWNTFPGIATGTDVYIRIRFTTDLLADTENGAIVEDPRSYGGAGDGEVEDYYIRVETYDGGDAPDTYDTLYTSGGPYHIHNNANLYIRDATHDNGHDQDGQPSNGAVGDDTDGIDDENADDLTPFPILATTDTSYTVGVPLYNATGSDAHLYGWIDFNQDGDFADAGEFTELTSIVNATNTSTSATPTTQLTWTGISGLTAGSTYMRLRLTNSVLTANDWGGEAINGEVEDHQIYIGDLDFGDAEDGAAGTVTGAGDYRSRLADDGPYHVINNNIYIGNSVPDSESDANPSSGPIQADGDDTTGSDDEDGVTLRALDNSPVPSAYIAAVNVTNNTGQDATMYGWIDWDRNGQFGSDEVAEVIVPTGTNGSVDITWNSFTGIATGFTLTRFRLTTDGLVNGNSGAAEDTRSLFGASDGEVEDHLIYIGDQDMGDAPDTYQTLSASDGPFHGRSNSATVHLGTATIDADTDGQPTSDASGDDNNGSDDENGLSQPLANIAIAATSYSVPVTLRNSELASNPATLVAWLDTNQDGEFSAAEVVSIINYDTTGDTPFSTDNIPYFNGVKTAVLTWNGISGLTNGSMALRIRISYLTDLTANDWAGQALDGEVEDYMVFVGEFDYGDAPDEAVNVGVNNYRTTQSDSGPFHGVDNNLFMGTVPDADNDAQTPTIVLQASGDDIVASDDEDGLILPPLTTTQGSYSANAMVTNNTGSDAYIYAWIDFDGNGRFDRDEFVDNGTGTGGAIVTSTGLTNRSVELDWTATTGLATGQNRYMRVRITSELLADSATGVNEDPRSYGGVSNGEIEDHYLLSDSIRYDGGDAPDSYLIRFADGGPIHPISTTLRLGTATTDGEDADGSSDALLDDITATADEDGIALPTLALSATSYTLDANVLNNTGANADLIVWIDWNQNGVFDAAEGQVISATSNGTNTVYNPSWNSLTPVTAGYYFGRARLAPNSDGLTVTDAGGIATSGEVEDFRISVLTAQDWGDAPDAYHTLATNNGANHAPSTNLYIGTTAADADVDGQPSVAADGDDNNATADETAPTFPVLSPSMTTWSFDTTVTNNTGSAATLHAWVDHDLDGEFQLDEYTSVAVADGATDLPISVAWTNLSNAEGGNVGDSYVRLRLTTDTLVDNGATAIDERSQGAATDGEIEDHYHKVTFHMLIQQDSGAIEYTLPNTANNTVALMENNYGVGYVTYELLVPTDNITTDFTLRDYQFILYQSDLAGGTSPDTTAEIDTLLDYRNQGGVLLSLVEGDTFADATTTRINAYMGQQVGFPGTSATGFAGYAGPTTLPRFHPSDGPGALSTQATVATTGTLSTITGIDHRSVIYTLPTVTGSCNNVDAMAWLIPYDPTTTGGYEYPRTHTGPWVGSGERAFYFTSNYLSGNLTPYQDLMDFVYDYYEDQSAFLSRNNWLADDANVNGNCSNTELDFDDLPDSGAGTATGDYITAFQFDGPRHQLGDNIFMGTAPDGETDAYATVAANGDTDDGVEILPLSSTATQYSVRVTTTNTTGTDGNVYAWADWNKNGDLEASEMQTIAVVDGETDTVKVLTWPITTAITNGDTVYVRVRICNTTTDCSIAIGEATNGEVEGYAISVSDNVDFGDAPDTYLTLAGTGGPFHYGDASLFIGDQVSDGEPDGIPTVMADGDDTNASPDDEDGVNVISPININATDYSLTVETTNTSGAVAYLVVWIDFDQSGTFEAGEGQIQVVPDASSEVQYVFNWTGLTGLTAGVTYSRIRISNDVLTTSSIGGIATNGEVEDHLIVMGTFDLGDAPDTYGTDRTNASGEGIGPMHIPSATIFLGTNATDAEANGFVDGIDDNGLAQDDDLAGVNDEDGVTIPAVMSAEPGSTETLTVRVHTDVDATVYAWLDFDRDGVFDVVTEAATPVSITAVNDDTDVTLTFTTPNDVLDGGSYVRVRICSTTTVCSTPHDVASDGEVEDHRIILDVAYDYGDAPETLGYNTLFTSNGARHRLGNTTLSLGSIIGDGDSDGFGDGVDDNGDATDDDTLNINDEDGISTIGFLSQGATDFTQDVVCNDHNGTIDIGANVYAWVDFNADGDFADSGEFTQAVCSDADAIIDGSASLSFSTINTSTIATETYMRLRITSETLTVSDYNGTAINGEVEDHQVPILKGPIQPITPAVVVAQCLNSGNIEGVSGTPVDITGVVNTYYPATANALTGTNSITVGTATGNTTETLNPGDRVMIIQMQNASIDTTNTDSYGNGVAGGYASGWTDYGTTGQYEFATVASFTDPTLVLSENLTNNFTADGNSSFQVVRIPMYEDARLTGTVTSADWDGSSGGIVSLYVNGTLDLNGNTIDVNGKGFRGGIKNTANGIATGLNYVMSVTNIDGGKGEGIAGTPVSLGGLGYNDGDNGIGAPANAGGGGNFNSGGGGGGNVGPGGRGGNYGSSTSYYPGEPGTGIGLADPTRLTLGGGGGAGQENNGVGRDGADGGGIVYITANTVTGTGTINANGNTSPNAGGDSPGGGGAGGSVLVYNTDGVSLSTLTVNAVGGNGASSSGGHGRSAGGGGGAAIFNSSGATANVSAGAATCSGQLLCGDDGGDGQVINTATLPTAPAVCSFELSGFVFDDSSTAPTLNGIKDVAEAGLGIAVPVIAYNTTTSECFVATADATTGAYSMTIPGGSYEVYEAAPETDLVNPTCPPTIGILDPGAGGYAGATIGDPINVHSSSPNIQVVSLTTDMSDINFADFTIATFPTCSNDGYLLRNNPTDITSINLALGVVTPLYNNVLPSATGVFGGTGYNFITNTLIGDNTKNKDTVLMVDGAGSAFVLPITGSTMTLNNYNSGDIDDNGVLLLMNNSGTNMYRIDVNPNSSTYLQQIGEITVSAPVMADMAINPIDNMLYTLTPTGNLVKFDPVTGARTNLGYVGINGETGTGWGAVYFDDQGFFYAAQNPNPGRIVRIDISDPSLPSGGYSAVNFTQMNAATGQNDGARCRFAPLPLDFGDAPETSGYPTTLANNGPRHLTEETGLYIGSVAADNENDGQPDADYAGDDNVGTAPDDEDVLSALITADVSSPTITQTVPVSNTTGSDAYLSGWIDFDNSGSFDNDESAWVIVPNGATSVTLTWNNVGTSGANISNSVVGYRLRISSDFNTITNTPLDADGNAFPDPIGPAPDGEIEDYRVLVSSLNGDNTCDIIVETKGDNVSGYDFAEFDPTMNPAQLNNIMSPITVNGYPNAGFFNSVGFNRLNGLFYGIFVDQDSVDGNVMLYVTDRDGTEFVSLGAITADGSQSFIHAVNGLATFNNNQPLSQTGSGVNVTSPTSGDVSPDGQYLYVFNGGWDSILRINLTTQEFISVPLSAPIVIGGDISFSVNDNMLYGVDLVTGTYYQINPTSGAVTSYSVNFNGLLPVSNTGSTAAGGSIMDDGVMLYAFANGGDHDTDGDNTHDLIDSTAVYQLNVVTGEMKFVIEGIDVSIVANDAAGCYYARDYGDAPISYGDAFHNYSDTGNDGDAALDGDQDLTLGANWDSEFVSQFSLDATGDDLQASDDEDGVTLPASITVATSTPVTVSVPQAAGFLNVFIDLNGDGDFADSGEMIIEDQLITAATTNLDFNLDAGLTAGYNGDTFARFRLCSTAATCNSPIGEAADGEVEDYQFELINQIILSGFVFEDNGINAATAAHDGVIDGQEQGIGDVTVNVIYNGAGAHGYTVGDIVATTQTSGDGSYLLVIPVLLANEDLVLNVVKQARWIDISEADVVTLPQVTNNSVIDSQMLINAAAGDYIMGLNFGKVQEPRMEPDNYTELEPGNFALFKHKFTSATAGDVTLAIVNPIGSPPSSAWTTVLYQDINCNGVIDGSDTQISASISVSGDTNICLVSKVFTPVDAPLNASYHYDIYADMVFADTASTGHGITRQVIDSDTVRVSFSGAGELKLNKTVANISQATTATLSNQGKPGDILEYTIEFINVGTGVVTDINIYDTTAAYTQLAEAVDCTNAVMPAGLMCQLLLPVINNTGYVGDIQWQLTGSLQPNQTGEVRYRVIIE
ncbi:GEVED domain-containing protein [Photobacterium phosphoreum]|uniref:GEVED domain-containing protein n=1 Tax=Photobacterium phosphoreum TaxID=659 RepID=UPI0011B26D94|nr:GEVED domain-containing protein [Photobacterium phosphoreum]